MHEIGKEQRSFCDQYSHIGAPLITRLGKQVEVDERLSVATTLIGIGVRAPGAMAVVVVMMMVVLTRKKNRLVRHIEIAKSRGGWK